MMPKHPSPPRLIAVAAASAVALLALTSCTAPAPDVDAEAPVTLRLALEATPPTGTVADLTEKYTAEFPNVTFEVEMVPNDQYGEVLRTQLQGGNAPDLFHLIGGSGTPTSALPLAEAGYLLPLTDTVAAELYTDASRVYGELDGEIWAQPVQMVPVLTNFNATAAEELGIDLEFDSLADLLDACPVAKDAGKSLFILAGSTAINNAGAAMQFAATRVFEEAPDWNQQRMDGDVSFADTDGWRESLELFITLRDAGCFQPGVEGGALEANFPAVASGTALGSFSPGGAVATLKSVNPDATFRSTAFPADDEGQRPLIFAPTNMLGVNAASSEANQAAALKFLEWLAEPENADALAQSSGNISIRAAAGDPMTEQYALLSETYDPEMFRPSPSLGWPDPAVYITLGTGVQGILTGQTTVDAVLESLDTVWDNAGQ